MKINNGEKYMFNTTDTELNKYNGTSVDEISFKPWSENGNFQDCFTKRGLVIDIKVNKSSKKIIVKVKKQKSSTYCVRRIFMFSERGYQDAQKWVKKIVVES